MNILITSVTVHAQLGYSELFKYGTLSELPCKPPSRTSPLRPLSGHRTTTVPPQMRRASSAYERHLDIYLSDDAKTLCKNLFSFFFPDTMAPVSPDSATGDGPSFISLLDPRTGKVFYSRSHTYIFDPTFYRHFILYTGIRDLSYSEFIHDATLFNVL